MRKRELKRMTPHELVNRLRKLADYEKAIKREQNLIMYELWYRVPELVERKDKDELK